MLSINNNLAAMFGVRRLGMFNNQLTTSLTRLSTGLRINSGADGPAGLIASENFSAQLASLSAATDNAERANFVLNTADGGLSQVGGLLGDLNGAVVRASNTAGLSSGERDALQIEVDSILSSINRIAGGTTFGGSRLIDGSRSFKVENVSDQIASVEVFGSNIGPGDSAVVNVEVTQAAEAAALALSFGGGNVDLGGSGGEFVFEVSGAEGSAEITVSSGESLDDIAAAINAQSDSTGATASVSGSTVIVHTDQAGADEFVSIEIIDDGGLSSSAPAGAGVFGFVEGDPSTIDAALLAAFTDGATATDEGVDVAGNINGVEAQGDGTTLSIDTVGLSISIDLATSSTDGAANAMTVGSVNPFSATGGALFQIGRDLGPGGRIGLGLTDARTSSLGSILNGGQRFSLSDLGAGGSLSLSSGNLGLAQRSIGAAISSVATGRGRIGAAQRNTIGPAINGIGIAIENMSAARSFIRDTDFAFEAASLARSSVLGASLTNVLRIANQSPTNALRLVG